MSRSIRLDPNVATCDQHHAAVVDTLRKAQEYALVTADPDDPEQCVFSMQGSGKFLLAAIESLQETARMIVIEARLEEVENGD